MMSLETLATFLGWCTVINFVILAVAGIAVTTMRGWMAKMHSSMTGVPEQELSAIYFKYLAYYKIAILVFNLAPYIALKVML